MTPTSGEGCEPSGVLRVGAAVASRGCPPSLGLARAFSRVACAAENGEACAVAAVGSCLYAVGGEVGARVGAYRVAGAPVADLGDVLSYCSVHALTFGVAVGELVLATA